MLVDVIMAQAQALQSLQESHDSLKAQLSEYADRMDKVERRQHRQAAPFGRSEQSRKPSSSHKPSGRKKGHKGNYRQPPSQVDFRQEVPLEGCPLCGGQLSGLEAVEQYIEELPIVRPVVHHITTYRARCCVCKQQVCSRHPLQVSEATGAAGSHLGPRAQAVCLALMHNYSLSKRKAAQLLEQFLGLKISAGGLVHLAHRNAGKLASTRPELLEQLQQSACVHMDETGWYVGAPKHWLWVMTNQNASIYHVDERRNREVVNQLLGPQFSGVLVSDCLIAYQGVTDRQQKCYAHHLKAISLAMEKRAIEAKVQEKPPDTALDYLRQVRTLLHAALHIGKLWRQDLLSDHQVQQARQRLKDQAELLLVPSKDNNIDEKIANRLRKQRQYLFTFLEDKRVDATNNLAERQLRPAVITRKISCGNKTQKGAQSWATIKSVITSFSQQGRDFTHFLVQLLPLHQPVPFI